MSKSIDPLASVLTTPYKSLKWVKNVKRNDGRNWAYMSDEESVEFQLNFSETQQKGARNLGANEMILLFQRVDKVHETPAKTYLTHIVKTLDDQVYLNDAVPGHPYEKRVAVIARAEPRTSITVEVDKLNFFKANRGKLCRIELLNSVWGQEKVAEFVWRCFDSHFNDSQVLASLIPNANPISEDLIAAEEGAERELLRVHLWRERNPGIVKAAKAAALQRDGKLRCDICNVCLSEEYGIEGLDFIECHHKIPIAGGGRRVTTLSDLALVCPNWHRMLHRKDKTGNYYSMAHLKTLVEIVRATRHPLV